MTYGSYSMITTLRRSQAHALVCVLALASFWFALLLASGRHTDDGCPVELHCFVCHWALAGTADSTLALPQVPPIELVGRTPTVEAPKLVEAPTPQPATRGPPTA